MSNIDIISADRDPEKRLNQLLARLRAETDKRPAALPGAPDLLNELVAQLERAERAARQSDRSAKTPLNESVIREGRLLKWIYWNDYYKKQELHWSRFMKETSPRSYWYQNEHWMLDLASAANNNEEYYLDLAQWSAREPGHYFCWLIRGRWSISFLHLRHVRYLEDLQELTWALARVRLFPNETAMQEFAATTDRETLRAEQEGE